MSCSQISTLKKENIKEGINTTNDGKTDITFHEHVKNTFGSASQMATPQQKEPHSAPQVTLDTKGNQSTIATNLYKSLIGGQDTVTELSGVAIRMSEQSDKKPAKEYQTIHTEIECSTYSTDTKDSVARLITWTSVNLPGLKGSISIDQLIKAKLLDHDVLLRLEMGLTTVEKVQATIAKFLNQPKYIAGLYLVSDKKKISFLEAAEKGILAKANAIEFLEAQAATGSSISLAAGKPQSFEDALENGHLDALLKEKLRQAHLAFSGYLHKNKTLTVFKAIEARLVDRCKGNSFLEVQIAAGGLVNPELGVRVPADIAIDRGLLTKATLQSLYEPVTNPKKFYNPGTKQKAYYGELLSMCVYDVDEGVYLLPFGDASPSGASPTGARQVSVISSHRGTEMSAYEAYKGKHISQTTYLFLSRREGEWVEESSVNNGGTRQILTDSKSGKQICIQTAVSRGYLEAMELASYRSGSLSIYELVDLIYSRMGVVEDVNSPIAGLWDATQKKRFSVFQAMQQNLVDRVTALRLLEAQVCTGGILDPASGEKATLKEALGWGLLDQSFALQLPLYEQAYQGVIQPKTGRRISVAQAILEGVFPKDIGLRCLEFQLLTGGLIDPETQSRISLEEVTRRGFLDKRTLDSLKDPKSFSKSIICPKTRRVISFMEALERSFHDYHTGLRLLEAVRPNWNYRYM